MVTHTSSLECQSTRTRTCAKCGRSVESPALFFQGREIFAERRILCDACVERYDADRQREIEAELHEKLDREWRALCPVSFRDTDPARLPDAEAVNAVLGWQYGPEGILASGETSLGKTRSFFLLLRRLHFEERRSIVAVTGCDFGLKVSSLFWKSQPDAAAYLERLCNVDILYVDDLDKAKFTERVEAELFNVIDHRTAHGKPILCTLNATGEELASHMSPHRGWPLVRRLADFCKSVSFINA